MCGRGRTNLGVEFLMADLWRYVQTISRWLLARMWMKARKRRRKVSTIAHYFRE